ncbi:MAG: hypothetical protein ACYSW8_14860 [Planctomycetota bacterium]|jgi:hypothetical protein
MSQDEHDIGKILGCILFALGSRELLAFIHRLVVGSTMLHIPLFQMLVIGIGIGLYFHKAFAWMILFAIMTLCEVFVLIVAIAMPVKKLFGYEVKVPGSNLYGEITTFPQLYVSLVIYGCLFAAVMIVLLTNRARREFRLMQNDK